MAALCATSPGAAAEGRAPFDRWVERQVAAATADGLDPVDLPVVLLLPEWGRLMSDWSEVDRLTSRLASGGADPLMADELRLLRARLALEEGRPDEARELLRGAGLLEAWWSVEAEPLDELADFARRARLPATGTAWRSTPGTDPLGWVRGAGLAWPASRQIVYLATTLRSDRQQPVAVRVGVAEVARVWLNGEAILTTPWPLDRGEDQATAGAWLRQGDNLIVVAVGCGRREPWARVRVTAPGGGRAQGVREVGEPPAATGPPADRSAPEVTTLAEEVRRAVERGRAGALTALAAHLVIRHAEPRDSGDARAACRTARAERPGLARLLERRLTSDSEAVRELLADTIEAEPDLLPARIELARWYHDAGLDAAAVDLLVDEPGPAASAELLDLDAERWGALVLRKLDHLSADWPGSVQVTTVLARRAMEAGHRDLAGRALARLGAIVPGDELGSMVRRFLAAGCGDDETVDAELEDALRRDPNRVDARVRLARKLAPKDGARASELIREGLDRCPDHPDLLAELALLHRAEGDDASAVEVARQLLEVRPQEQRARRLLRHLGEGGDDDGWLRSPGELLRLAPRAADDDVPTTMLLDHVEVHALPGQLVEHRVQRAWIVHDAARATDLRVHTIPWVPERQRIEVMAARVHRADGRVVSARQHDTPRLAEPEINLFYDVRLRALRLPELEGGDVVEIAWVVTETAESNETGPYAGGIVRLPRRAPTRLVEVELVARGAPLPSWELVGLEGEPERVESAELTRLVWSFSDLPARPADDPPAPELLVTPHLVYSNHPTWEELADWYGRHVEPRLRTSVEVAERAVALVEGVDDRLQRIARIYRFVTDEIRYVGLEFGEHRFRPFSADWVLEHRIGDCKDTAALLVAALDAVGIPARMAMIRTADLGPLGSDLAVLEAFNHAIAYLPEDDLWLDGTAAGHAPFPPPPLDQGAVALVVDPRGATLQTTPSPGAGVARVQLRVEREKEAAGRLRLSLRTEDTGAAADRRRAALTGGEPHLELSRRLQRMFPGADVDGPPRIESRPGRDPVVVEIDATVGVVAVRGVGGVPTFPGDPETWLGDVPAPDRRGPLVMVAVPDLEWTVDVDLGREPRRVPDDVDLVTRFGFVRIEHQPTPDGYRVEGTAHLSPGVVSAGDAPELHAFLAAAGRHLQRPLEAP